MRKTLKYISYFVVAVILLGVGGVIGEGVTSVFSSASPVHALQATTFINMTTEDFNRIKAEEMIKMVTDTAKAYNIKPSIFCGLAYHESAKFSYANQKIKDSNGRWSYGLFMIQMETALLYDKNVTETKLLDPSYNTHLSAIIFKKNFIKYGSRYDYALAAHNAFAVYNNKITNMDFVKKVKEAIGDVSTKYDL